MLLHVISRFFLSLRTPLLRDTTSLRAYGIGEAISGVRRHCELSKMAKQSQEVEASLRVIKDGEAISGVSRHCESSKIAKQSRENSLGHHMDLRSTRDDDTLPGIASSIKISTIKTLTILFLLFAPNLSYSKGKELDAIIINADDVVIDKKTSSSIFTGHVILWFDNGLIIETDKVILTIKEANNKKSLDRIIMPSKLRAIRDGEGIATTPSEATLIAEEAEYIEEKSELRLKGDVYIRDNDNFVKCNELVYYTNVKKLSTNGR